MSIFAFLEAFASFSPVLAYIIAVFYDWLINQILIRNFQSDINDYKRDWLAKFSWGAFIFGPIVASFFIVLKSSQEIQKGIDDSGVILPEFVSHPWGRFIESQFFLSGTIIFALVLGTIVAEGYARRGRPKWAASKPAILYCRAYLVDFPLTLAVVYSIAFLLRDWLKFYDYLKFAPLPNDLFHPDRMYGLAWSYKGLLIETAIVATISLAPLIMYIRQKKTWFYTAVSLLGLGVFATYVFYLVPKYNTLFATANANFYNQTVQAWSQITNGDKSQESSLQELVLLSKLEIIENSPKGIGIVFVSLTTVTAVYNASLLVAKAVFNKDLNKSVASAVGRPIRKFLGLTDKKKAKAR